MTYLPPAATQATYFPTEGGADLATSVALIEERWRVTFPQVSYFPLDKRVTPSDSAHLSGESGASKFDPVWGETVDSARTTWAQPHGTAGSVKAADVEVYRSPVSLYAKIQVVEDEKDMRKYGFDNNDRWIAGLVLTIPASMLDTAGITCIAGDKFAWDGDEYSVRRARLAGYYFNSNVRLYVKLGCDRRRHGS